MLILSFELVLMTKQETGSNKKAIKVRALKTIPAAFLEIKAWQNYVGISLKFIVVNNTTRI